MFQKYYSQEIEGLRTFPGGVVIRTPCFHHGGLGSIPGQGTEKPYEALKKKEKKEEGEGGGEEGGEGGRRRRRRRRNGC